MFPSSTSPLESVSSGFAHLTVINEELACSLCPPTVEQARLAARVGYEQYSGVPPKEGVMMVMRMIMMIGWFIEREGVNQREKYSQTRLRV